MVVDVWFSERVLTSGRVGLVVVLLLVPAGCANDDKTPTRQLEVCVPAGVTHRDGDRVTVEFRDAGELIASGSIPVGAAFGSEVPAGHEIVATVDGEAVGTSGGSADARLGC
ncbi:hypothetical protein KOI35_18760 [Actinoplanes bogorensis]|uniref:Uncharacterized protein n=1 Tax=Paractinoplanes bogorensis TaxID=1610840 RepID=A0ABS5YS50_9ACTN|nr:hypothetical protein [Actinoplanes bogorensis]MBU2665554.1 hypothetical protein [Actinoplanes bogorensis]